VIFGFNPFPKRVVVGGFMDLKAFNEHRLENSKKFLNMINNKTCVIYSRGSEQHLLNGVLHRKWQNGPAKINYFNPDESEYYEYGIKMTLEEFQAISKIQKWFKQAFSQKA